MNTSLTWSAVIPALEIAPLIAMAPNFAAGTDAKEPRNEPIGVLATDIM